MSPCQITRLPNYQTASPAGRWIVRTMDRKSGRPANLQTARRGSPAISGSGRPPDRWDQFSADRRTGALAERGFTGSNSVAVSVGETAAMAANTTRMAICLPQCEGVRYPNILARFWQNPSRSVFAQAPARHRVSLERGHPKFRPLSRRSSISAGLHQHRVWIVQDDALADKSMGAGAGSKSDGPAITGLRTYEIQCRTRIAAARPTGKPVALSASLWVRRLHHGTITMLPVCLFPMKAIWASQSLRNG